MKCELRPAIHMERQLGWAHKLGGTESLAISRAGQTVLARLVEALGGWAQRWDNGLCPPFCLGENCPPAPTLKPDTSLSAAGAFQAATPVLELRGSESE